MWLYDKNNYNFNILIMQTTATYIANIQPLDYSQTFHSGGEGRKQE